MPNPPILLVEDDLGILTMLELALRERGHATTSARTVRDAIRAATDDRPALVFLDIRLGGEDGRAVAATIRDLGLPVIVMSASSNPGEMASEVGAAGSLAKPFDLDDLYAVVDRFVPADP